MPKGTVTLADVAKRARVAIMTASKAMNGVPTVRGYLRERVLAAARELDYQPNLIARAMVNRSQNLVTCSVTDIMNPYFGRMAHCINMSLAERDHHAIFVSGSGDLDGMTRGYRAAGSIMMIASPEHVKEVVRTVPVVTIGGIAPDEQPAPDVYIDLAAAYRDMARRVLDHGRTRVAWHCAPIADANNRPAKFGHVVPVLKRRKLDPVELPAELMGRPRELAEAIASGRLTVDAIFCQHDLEANAVMLALLRAGLRCPEDVVVIGCDGNYIVDGLWTIRVDVGELARHAVDLLMRQIGGERVEKRLVLPTVPVTPGAGGLPFDAPPLQADDRP
jgi:DNA-binding LacI/PurR family transcriptional regulator